MTVVGVYCDTGVLPAAVGTRNNSAVSVVLNPFSYVIWVYQDVLYFGAIVHPVAWIVFLASSLLSLALGYRSFRAV